VSESAELEHALKNLSTIGTPIKLRAYRQVWRFEHAGPAYYLKFYPRAGAGAALKRIVRGSPAWREFTNLQALQRARIPSPRAIAHLSGFMLQGCRGDAVILEAIEPSAPLDAFINDCLLRGQDVPGHREIARKLVDMVQALGRAGLGHADLHLGNFLLKGDDLFLLDGYAVRRGGLRVRDVMLLGHSVDRFASKTELLRGWNALRAGPLPLGNPLRRRQWRKAIQRSLGENDSFGRIDSQGWRGVFFKRAAFPRRWAPASRLSLDAADWQREWPALLARLKSDQFESLKRSDSGDVLSGEIVLAGRPVSVIIKHPRRRYWYRYFTEIGRGDRARRAWLKAWALIARDIPTAWPLLLMQRRRFGYGVESVIVFERVAGRELAQFDLGALKPAARQNLFRRLGRTLRRMEQRGLSQYDAKSANWMIVSDPLRGPTPVVIDVDGIRRIVPRMGPIERLLMSMRQHPQYTVDDSRELCLGYAPFARLAREQGPEPDDEADADESISADRGRE
jgi:tRNA A-37 threonylcarbamoyl transferase component Bud32